MIVVVVEFLDQFFVSFFFVCIFSINQLSYQEEIGQQRASLTVLWNSDAFIDRTNCKLIEKMKWGKYN